jgi:hypothetical protein
MNKKRKEFIFRLFTSSKAIFIKINDRNNPTEIEVLILETKTNSIDEQKFHLLQYLLTIALDKILKYKNLIDGCRIVSCNVFRKLEKNRKCD